MKIAVSRFASVKDNRPVGTSISWERLTAHLTRHERRAEKDGPLWCPVRYRSGTTRGLEGAETVHALVLDFDGGTDPQAFREQWEHLEYVLHSTYSSTAERPCWRAVFPLAAPVPAAEWPRVYARAATALGGGLTDPSCKDASRIYFLPACPSEAEPFAEQHAGAWLDPEQFPEPPEPETIVPSRVRLERSQNGTEGPSRPASDVLLARALGDLSEGRNVRALWLACQLRDNGYSEMEAEPVLLDFAAHCPGTSAKGKQEAFTEREALSCLRSAFSRPSREPWERAVTLRFPRRDGAPERVAQVEPDLSLEEAARVALEACAALKDDPGAVWTDEALVAIALVRRWDIQNWARVKSAIQKRRVVSLKELYARLPRIDLPEEDRTRLLEGAPPSALAGDTLHDCPAPTLAIPEPYQVLEACVVRMGADKDGDPKPFTLAFAPVLPTGRMRDAVTGEESLLLSWRWPGDPWRSRVVERSQALTGRELVKLSAVGFPVADDSAKGLVGYLHRVEAANRLTLPCAAVSSHLGWQGDPETAPFLCGRTLILPDGSREEARALDVDRPEEWNEQRVCFHGIGAGEEQIVDAFCTAGTLDGWRNTARLLAPYPKALIAFYASFCAPLLAVFGVPNFIVDLSNRTSTGKTTALRGAASIWGNPDERQASSLVGTWDATRVWTERASHVMSGLPLIMDDTKKARQDGRAVADLIYAVASGRGRGRGTLTGLAQTATWRTVMLSSGEQPATAYTQDGGTRTRVLSLRGTPFGDADLKTGKVVAALNTGLCQHYGHAGPIFLSWLMRERPHWDGWRREYAKLVARYTAEAATPEGGRLAQYAALVSVAGAMAHEALSLPWTHTQPIDALWSELASEAADAAGDLRALEHVLSWAHSHEHTFYGRTPSDRFGNDTFRGPFSGRWDEGEDWPYLAFFPNVIRELLADEEFHPDAIFSGWKERGWLNADAARYTCTMRPHSGKDPTRMVAILRHAFKALDSPEEPE